MGVVVRLGSWRSAEFNPNPYSLYSAIRPGFGELSLVAFGTGVSVSDFEIVGGKRGRLLMAMAVGGSTKKASLFFSRNQLPALRKTIQKN